MNGKEVQVVIELQARFDERNNIKVTQSLQEAGIQVIFGVAGLKTHSKLLLDAPQGGAEARICPCGDGQLQRGHSRVFQ